MLKLNKIRRFLAFAIILAAVSMAVTITLKVQRSKVPAETLRRLPVNVDVALQKIHYTETKDGVKKWDLLADQAVLDKKGETVHLTGVRLIVAAGGKTGDIVLTADRADYDSRSKDVRLAGNVEAKSASGMRFSTESAMYEAGRSMINSTDRVKFSDGRLDLDGVGMELATSTRNVKIMKDVTASVRTGISK